MYSARFPDDDILIGSKYILLGLILDITGKEPVLKSAGVRETAKLSLVCWLVIWHSMISSPGKSAKTNAGLFLDPDKSENGKGIITASPFINFSMHRLLLRSASLSPKSFRSQEMKNVYLL